MQATLGSKLVLLDQVRTIESGTKIRFLGCVHSYDGQTATLLLNDHFPASNSAKSTVAVNVRHVLEALKWETFQVGYWLNVIGYVKQKQRRSSGSRGSAAVSYVEANMVWAAGAIDPDHYKRTVTALQESSLASD